jgi:chloride channel protein, CIC family
MAQTARNIADAAPCAQHVLRTKRGDPPVLAARALPQCQSVLSMPTERVRAFGRWAHAHLPLAALAAREAPVDLRLVGQTLLRAALVGAVSGLFGAFFFWITEYAQYWVLERFVGYRPLRAAGEILPGLTPVSTSFAPALLLVVPALGALIAGLLAARAPEIRGGGTDAMIEAFHHRGGYLAPRLIWRKLLASITTLASGGAGGRAGPTMFIGGALGVFVGGLMRVGARERRLLLVAGAAAGICAVFRTPLGAALLAVEVLYRDGFESDALVPSILASVVSYSVVISLFGDSTLFGRLPRFPFIPAHLPLYALLALCVAVLAVALVRSLTWVRRVIGGLRAPDWSKPALGALGLGLLATPVILLVSNRIARPGQGLGLLGGGYGAVQLAISGAAWLPSGVEAVEILLLLCLAKIVAASLTIGSGGSAGDFAPSLAVGGLFGSAFGGACQLLFDDPRIHPGAFALVGMGTLYGGIAHAPLSALVLVCEMAGSYDLLVPLMLAEGIAFVALRRTSLYPAQLSTQQKSPAHRDAVLYEVLTETRVAQLMTRRESYVRFELRTPLAELLRAVRDAGWQDVFPVHGAQGELAGIVTAAGLHGLALQGESCAWLVAADAMQPPVFVRPADDLRSATDVLVASGLRELLVVDGRGEVAGFLDEADIARSYSDAAARAERLAPA